MDIEKIDNKMILKTDFADKVKKWVLLDSQLRIINEKINKIRNMKHEIANDICNCMNEKKNNKIMISDGELKIYEKKEYSPLTYSHVEKCLAELITDKEKVDYIIQYIKNKRETKMVQDIKRIFHGNDKQNES